MGREIIHNPGSDKRASDKQKRGFIKDILEGPLDDAAFNKLKINAKIERDFQTNLSLTKGIETPEEAWHKVQAWLPKLKRTKDASHPHIAYLHANIVLDGAQTPGEPNENSLAALEEARYWNERTDFGHHEAVAYMYAVIAAALQQPGPTKP